MKILCDCQSLQVQFPNTAAEFESLVKDFQNISSRGVIDKCCCAIDGYLLHIKVPNKDEAKNVRSFFSGHYQKYGINIQGACDAYCRFLFLRLGGPDVTPDRLAVENSGLLDLLNRLPLDYVAIGDCAYPVTEKLFLFLEVILL